MGAIEEFNASSPKGESKTRTPAYASFASNTDKLSHLLKFVLRGIQDFADELKTNIAPQIHELCTESVKLPRGQDKEVDDEETDQGSHDMEQVLSGSRNRAEVVHQISDILIEPAAHFIDGLSTVRQWIPVILVTTVEAYLKDVRMYEARANPTIMESSEQSVTYADVVRSQSIGELTEEMQSRWARKFVDDGGPTRWIDKLTRMGARAYDSQVARKMETLWGVRHVIVHSAGVATPDFVRRHPDFGARVGESILIQSHHLHEWISAAYHFVEVTDFYFVKRYGQGPVSIT